MPLDSTWEDWRFIRFQFLPFSTCIELCMFISPHINTKCTLCGKMWRGARIGQPLFSWRIRSASLRLHSQLWLRFKEGERHRDIQDRKKEREFEKTFKGYDHVFYLLFKSYDFFRLDHDAGYYHDYFLCFLKVK